MIISREIFFFFILFFCCSFCRLDEIIYIKTRDGVSLLTRIWYPDEEIFPPPWATIYETTPYSVDDLEQPSASYYTTIGYAYMGQEQRGREGSNGTYSFFRTSGNDSLDTIQWWLNNANWTNGLFAVSGISADCLAQYTDVLGVTQSGYWPNGNYSYYQYLFDQILTGTLALGNGLGHQTVYQGGAYREGLITGWLDDLDEPDTVTTVLENERFGPYWYTLDGLWENQWNLINTTFINFAGWYDIFGNYQIETIIDVNSTASEGARGQQLLIVDPGGHCPLGAILWEQDLYGWEYMILEVIPKIFEATFKAKKNHEKFDVHDVVDWNVLFYMLGPGGLHTKGNFWVIAKSFPPIIRYDSYYLSTNKALLLNNNNNNVLNDSLSYLYNPFNPVKTWGGSNLIIQPCGPQDQKVVEKNRTDILHFTSDVFNDYYVITGKIIVELFVSSTAVDTDFTCKVIDLYPDGRAMLIQDSITRMRWRNLMNNPFDNNTAPNMRPDQIYNITIEIGYMSWLFNPEHALQISISSSNYKRFSINYNTGNFVIDGNISAINATNTVHFGQLYPSRIIIPVVDLNWVEEHKVNHTLSSIKDYTRGHINKNMIRNMKENIYNKKKRYVRK